MLDPNSTQELISKYEIKFPKQRIASSEEETVRMAKEIGGPIVLKIASSSIAHKTDLGGVKLNLATESDIRGAYHQLAESFPELKKSGRGRVLLQEMVQGSPPVELIFGAKRDSTFGCVLLFGIGGVMIELTRDIAMCVEPWSDEDIRRMFDSVKARQLLDGFRGSKPIEKESLLGFAKNLGRLLRENEEIEEVDLNPVIQTSQGEIVALDFKIMIRDTISHSNVEQRARPTNEEIKIFFGPKNIAVIGASNDPNKIGGMVIPRLLKFGYDKKRIFPVNPSQDSISGLPCYKSIESVPEQIELACISVQAPVVPAIIEQLGKKGAKCALIFSAGFSESGNASLQRDLQAKAREYRIRLCGPNSEGIISSVHKSFASFSHRFDHLQSLGAGSASIVSQSGGIMTYMAVSLAESGAGFCNLVSVGNESDLDVPDIMNFYANDPQTQTVGAFIEGIRSGPRFIEAAKALKAAGKPLIVYKAGRSNKGARAAGLHTGALAGSYDVFKAVLRQLGIIETESLGEISDILTALAFQPLPRGDRLVVVSASGGINTIVADWCDKNSINLQEFSDSAKTKLGKIMPELGSGTNPVDFPAQTMSNPRMIQDTLDVLSDEGDIFLVVMIGGVGFARAYAELCAPIISRNKPLITCWFSPRGVNEDARRALHECRMPVYSNPFESMKVVQVMLALARSGS